MVGTCGPPWSWPTGPSLRAGETSMTGDPEQGERAPPRPRLPPPPRVLITPAKEAPMPLLVVGTRNPKKRLELLEILGEPGIELRDLSSYPAAPDVVEDGATFEDNARKKATELA